MNWKLRVTSVLLVALVPALQACTGEGAAPAKSNPGSIGAQPSGANQASRDESVATVNGEPITMRELQKPLIEGYGLKDLLLLVKLRLAHQALVKEKIVLIQSDIDAERQITFDQMKRDARQLNGVTGAATTLPDDKDLSPAEADQLLSQVLSTNQLNKTEYDIILETNACLRKIGQKSVTEKMTDEAVLNQFNAEYGEKVLTRMIVCQTRGDTGDVYRDLQAGKKFEDVARARSIVAVSAAGGGEFRPFTRQDNSVPSQIRSDAFSHKVGEVSDVIEVNGLYYILKVIAFVPPAHAVFKDYKEAVRMDLIAQLIQESMKLQREQLARMALDSLRIQDPVMAQQYLDRLDTKSGQIRDKEKITQSMEKQRKIAATQSSPTTNPFENPASSEPTAPTSTVPAPATMPAER